VRARLLIASRFIFKLHSTRCSAKSWSFYANLIRQIQSMSTSDSELAKNRLLVIDDEPGITRLIELAAKRLGFSVLSIHESDRFEAAFHALQPTVIFLDINMPGRDGLELIAHLASANYDGKVVVMSGSDPRFIQMSSTIGKTRGLTVAGTLTKPFRQQQVLDLLAGLETT
jgi:DNA-binding response OmpR family regulator